MSNCFHIYLYGENRRPIPTSFERLSEQLILLDRMFFEMDGSFVWTGAIEQEGWQLDGMIYDAVGEIQYIDIKGWCPLDRWLRLLEIVGGQQSWSPGWHVLRLPMQQEQKLEQFNCEIWRT